MAAWIRFASGNLVLSRVGWTPVDYRAGLHSPPIVLTCVGAFAVLRVALQGSARQRNAGPGGVRAFGATRADYSIGLTFKFRNSIR